MLLRWGLLYLETLSKLLHMQDICKLGLSVSKVWLVSAHTWPAHHYKLVLVVSGPWKIMYQIQFASVVIRQSGFVDMSISHWIQRGTLSPIIDGPTMAWPLHPLMDMCHLAMGCSGQAKQFCWCVYSSLDWGGILSLVTTNQYPCHALFHCLW